MKIAKVMREEDVLSIPVQEEHKIDVQEGDRNVVINVATTNMKEVIKNAIQICLRSGQIDDFRDNYKGLNLFFILETKWLVKLSGDGFFIGNKAQIKLCSVILDTSKAHSKVAVHDLVVSEGKEYPETVLLMFSTVLSQLQDWQNNLGEYDIELYGEPKGETEFELSV